MKSVRYEKLEFKYFLSYNTRQNCPYKVKGPMRKAAGSFCEKLGFRKRIMVHW